MPSPAEHLLSVKVHSSWLLSNLPDILLLEDIVLSSCSHWLLLAAPLLWADSLPYCTGSFVPARHAEMSQNIGVAKISVPAKISQIFAKL